MPTVGLTLNCVRDVPPHCSKTSRLFTLCSAPPEAIGPFSVRTMHMQSCSTRCRGGSSAPARGKAWCEHRSGDRALPVEAAARQNGLDHWQACATPADKVKRLEMLKVEGKHVLMTQNLWISVVYNLSAMPIVIPATPRCWMALSPCQDHH